MQVRWELGELKTNCRPRLYAFLAWKRILGSLSDLKLGCYKVVWLLSATILSRYCSLVNLAKYVLDNNIFALNITYKVGLAKILVQNYPTADWIMDFIPIMIHIPNKLREWCTKLHILLLLTNVCIVQNQNLKIRLDMLFFFFLLGLINTSYIPEQNTNRLQPRSTHDVSIP